MSEGEPAVLGDAPDPAAARSERAAAPTPSASERTEPSPAPSGMRGARAETVYVVGFWKRLVAGWIDFAVILPLVIVLTIIVGKIAGVHLPPSNSRSFDFWLDLVLAGDPALVLAFSMLMGVALLYLLVFQLVAGRTLGMRLLKLKVIDVYGQRPSPVACALRTAGYAANTATLMLGFFWIGFDAEKRGLHDWIAGTYVVRS